ncbi:MAG: YCF48-related protein [Bacteroidota bacterium]
MRSAALLALLVFVSACASSRADREPPGPILIEQTSGTDALLIAAHTVDEDVVWLSGTGGTVVRTTDGGDTWTASVVPGADSLQLRDLHALDAQTAWALSIGTGDDSRIFKTTDGGATWRQVFVNPEAEGFFDCLSMWDAQRGLAFSDSVEGAFLIVTTADGGETWTRVPASALPPAADGEGGFAASGTCVATRGANTAWIATGNADPARVLRTSDGGATWTAAVTPLAAGEAAGAASVTFRDDQNGVALGGDIGAPEAFSDAVAITSDGGTTWTPGGRLPFAGAAYGAAYVPGSGALLAVGPGGAALSRDDGRTWTLLDDRTFWGVAAASPEAAWITGPEGRVVRVMLE